ncbi:MAG: L,D-transpeptidase [Chloroflexi bacterium]|nr:L,D-transpeptidase [Chloroflexota bacterium]
MRHDLTHGVLWLGSGTRRGFLQGAAAAVGSVILPWSAQRAAAEPQDAEAKWVANHLDARLAGADGTAVAWLPRWTRLRILRSVPGGLLEVWVPRLGLVGRVQTSVVGPVVTPSAQDLAAERAAPAGPPVIDAVGLPGRIVGGANLRLWPDARPDTLLRTLAHNAAVRAVSSVEGGDGDPWYRVQWMDGAMEEAVGEGYVHNSLVRLPRLPYATASADRSAQPGRWFEADLQEPAMLTAFVDGAPIWASLSLKGRAASRTALGIHQILRQVPSEIMNSETLVPPVPRTAPGGYYLKDVLWTQYFLSDGSSIHYNYWSSNWGYAGSNGCLGLPKQEAKFAWDFAEIGTPVRVFA